MLITKTIKGKKELYIYEGKGREGDFFFEGEQHL